MAFQINIYFDLVDRLLGIPVIKHVTFEYFPTGRDLYWPRYAKNWVPIQLYSVTFCIPDEINFPK